MYFQFLRGVFNLQIISPTSEELESTCSVALALNAFQYVFGIGSGRALGTGYQDIAASPIALYRSIDA